MAPRFDLQSHSTHSDGVLPRGRGRSARRRRGRGAAGAVRPRHDQRRRRGDRRRRASRRAGRLRGRDLCRRRRFGGPPRTAHPRLQHRPHRPADDRPPRRVPRRPRAPHAAHGATRCARSASSSTKRRSKSASRRANRSAARTSPARCCARPPTPQRLADENIDDVGSLIRGYLIEGKSAFRLRQTPTVGEAIDAIHEAGGVAIWAHPFWDISDPDEVLSSIDRFHALGIDGVEAFYITHTSEQHAAARRALRRARAAEHRLGRLPRP